MLHKDFEKQETMSNIAHSSPYESFVNRNSILQLEE